jgi:hypothetical protein
MRRIFTAAALVAALVAVFASVSAGKGPPPTPGHGHGKGHGKPPTLTVFATGLNNPRGLHFGPDGNLYVAEGGLGGNDSTVGQCDQVVPPVGPYTGSTNDRFAAGGSRRSPPQASSRRWSRACRRARPSRFPVR